MPEDFLVAMAQNRKAKTFFDTLNSANRYAILFRIQTAKKAETRARRSSNSSGCWRGTRRSIPERVCSARGSRLSFGTSQSALMPLRSIHHQVEKE